MSNQKAVPVPRAGVWASVRAWADAECVTFSSLLEERVSNLQALRMAQAFAAFTAMAVCASFSLWRTFLSLAWFALSLYLCRKGGVK